MKTVFTFFLLVSSLLFSQEETIFDKGIYESGGFGAPVLAFTTLNGEPAILKGGRGGWIINNMIVIGGGGYSTISRHTSSGISHTYGGKTFEPNIRLNYGGLELEFISNPNRIVHTSFYLLIGGGDIRLEAPTLEFPLSTSKPDYKSDEFFILDPRINVEINLVSWFRVNAGIGYRAVFGVDYQPFDDIASIGNSDIGGFTAMMTFKFGKF